MPKMQTVAHFEVEMPHATADEMQQAEQLMRDPDSQAEMLAAMSDIANRRSQAAGFPHAVEITGTIHAVTHHH